MENASKALIIAGAILLAILIISLGILIFNQAKGVMDNNAMSKVETMQFNENFLQYEGTKVRGATVKTMISYVLSNNMSQDDADRKVEIKGAVTMTKDATTAPLSSIATGATYTVECQYGDKGGNKGLVTSITITKN